MNSDKNSMLIFFACLFVMACAEKTDNTPQRQSKAAAIDQPVDEQRTDTQLRVHKRNPYFGDVHVHTAYSLDAYIIFNRTTPRDAYTFAQGGEIDFYQHPRKLDIPLDFAAVTEHAEFLGESLICSEPTRTAYKTDMCTDMRNEQQDPALENRTFVNVLLKVFKADKPERLAICGENGEDCLAAARTRWQEIQAIADEFNTPGEFTTFIAYEWTGEQGGNRHRNVIFRNNTVPATPWSMIEVPTVEQLWQKLDEECLPPCEVLTISHNSNQSNGLRFAGVNADGMPFTAEQADYRAEHEPLVEIMQFKGESECRLGLGTEDEFCDFEKYDLRPICPTKPAAGSSLQCVPACDENGQPEGCVWARNYVRQALRDGLELQAGMGANPYKLGVLGSTDTHNANPGNTVEDNYQGNFGYLDANAEERLLLALKTGFKQLSRNPGALAGVWAEENTRESIFAAMLRRETFATSGNRTLIRFFAGWDYPATLDETSDPADLGYRLGVAMGSALPASDASRSPRFIIWAAKGIDGGNLQRVQLIKAWVEQGESKEQVYDVLCADGLVADPVTHRCPDNGASVNLADCRVSPDKGAAELRGIWEDPHFDPEQHAFYYARVLENPSCRWSTYDALSLGRKPPLDAPATIQERAWSSPIWYQPADE